MIGLRHILQTKINHTSNTHYGRVTAYITVFSLIVLFVFLQMNGYSPNIHVLTRSPISDESQTAEIKRPVVNNEVFGFVPYWVVNGDKLSNIDFRTLTTLAYFGIPVNRDGSFDTGHKGYRTLESAELTDLFRTAHEHGTRVVLTLTQMDNPTILAFLDNEEAQKIAVDQALDEVKRRGLDGVNIDFEYVGDPGQYYREKFSGFVSLMTERMHNEIASSKVTVSVYASAVKYPKIYDIGRLGQVSDAIFMMAYDFAVKSAQVSMPTAPLYGYKEGNYWYDISTAVDDFLTLMPPGKLILGLPWYGYNYPVSKPSVNAATAKGYYVTTYRRRKAYKSYIPYNSAVLTYSLIQNTIHPDMKGVSKYLSGWDDIGKVSWKAYFSTRDNIWRMVFVEDEKSLRVKYSFAKEKKLAGIGIWALGFDAGRTELWDVINEVYGTKLVDATIQNREVPNDI